jgi:hydrogenase-4 component F
MILIYFTLALITGALTFRSSNRKRTFIYTYIFLFAQTLFLVYAACRKDTTELGIFTYDSLGILFFGVMSAIAFAVLYHSEKYLDSENINQIRLYNTGFISLCMTITGVYFSNNITASWVMIEATTLGSALLIYHRRTPYALEAAWKYVFVCSLGILIAYLGILFLSIVLKNSVGDLSFDGLAGVIFNANPLYLKLAFVFILTGYSCKMEFFPLYPIGIDANHVTPTPMSAFISTAMVNLGFVSIFRVYKLFIVSPVASWMCTVMFVTGLITLLVATVYIIQVQHYKRLFAYSTVENMGIALLILSTGKTGMTYAVFHVLMHSLIKSTMFLRLSDIGKVYGSYKTENTGNYRQVSRGGTVVLLFCLLGLTAIPPSALFISEMYAFSELSQQIAAFIFVALMICVILYFLCFRFVGLIYGDKTVSPVHSDKIGLAMQLTLLGAFFFMGLYQPQWLMNLINECAR